MGKTIHTARSDEYFAGLFDGEGCVYVQTCGQFSLRAAVRMMTREPLDALRVRYGGGIYAETRKDGKTIFLWTVNAQNAIHFLGAIQPFVLNKRRQVEVALCYKSLIGRGNAHRTTERLAIANELKMLKKEYI